MNSPAESRSPAAPVDAAAFKLAMAQFPSGVTVVTTEHGGRRYGMTVAAFASVSLAPPMVLVCIANTASSHDPIAAAKRFAVHILGAEQVSIASRFAGMLGLADRFEGLAIETAVTGAPIVPGCVAYVDCELSHTCAAGDHTIFVGHVVASHVRGGRALIHHERAWRTVSHEPLDPLE